jgi:hypothetical protein
MAIDRPAETGDTGTAGAGSVQVEPKARAFSLRAVIAVVLCGLLGYLAFAILPVFTGGPPSDVPPTPVASASSPAPMQAPGVTAQPPAVAAPPAPAGVPAAPPERLVYPAAEIDVAVLPLDPDSVDGGDRTIVPPATTDGYWLTPFGMPGADSTNTTYIVGHSWQDLQAPFNRLSTHAAEGDRLTVATPAGVTEYQVDSVTTYVKSGLKDSPIWEVAPQRLVLISCYTDDLWGTNVVVVASPVA